MTTATMKAIQVAAPGGDFVMVELPLPEPGPGEVRIRVEACGVCHSDATSKDGGMPGMRYPLVPGHEIAGVIEALGDGVVEWRVGQRVGAGWFGGQCGHCPRCRRGEFMSCLNRKIHGVTRDGGYAEAVVAAADSLALIPDDLASVEAAPMLCAGVTVYNALANCGARPGAVVAILGLGGLGHLAVQFAAKMGYRTVAIARGEDKGVVATRLGAHHYIDSTVEDVAAALQALGGAAAVVATVTNAEAVGAVVGGLAIDGKLIVVGVPGEAFAVYAWQLLYGRTVTGSAGGTGIEAQDALNFSSLHAIRPIVQTLPLAQAAEAYARMLAGDARFRIVLTP